MVDLNEKSEIEKIKKRIPKWFANPHQINHKILIAFLELQEKQDDIRLDDIERNCRVETFKDNYDQMKKFGKKNHGKVFEEKYGSVELWQPVKEFILNEYKKFKN